MNLPKRLYPHFYEFYKLQDEGGRCMHQKMTIRVLAALEYESFEIFKLKRYREKNLGTDKEIHKMGAE